MKRIVGLIMILVAVTAFNSCEKVKGKGEVVNEVRNISGFTGINLAIDATVYFSPDSSYYLEVEAQQNILDVLETVIGPDHHLTIRYKNNVVVGKHEPIRIFVAGPSIGTLTISGSGDIMVDTPWKDAYLTASISGSGNINISELEGDELHVNISGSGSVIGTTGSVVSQTLNISGSGNIDLLGVESENTTAVISGSGSMTVWATQLLDVTISGSGNVSYKGDPVITTHISGSGSVIKL